MYNLKNVVISHENELYNLKSKKKNYITSKQLKILICKVIQTGFSQKVDTN